MFLWTKAVDQALRCVPGL